MAARVDQQRRATSQSGSSPESATWTILIQMAYRQIFHEQQMVQANRLLPLESQLRAGLIPVSNFIRGLEHV